MLSVDEIFISKDDVLLSFNAILSTSDHVVSLDLRLFTGARGRFEFDQ